MDKLLLFQTLWEYVNSVGMDEDKIFFVDTIGEEAISKILDKQKRDKIVSLQNQKSLIEDQITALETPLIEPIEPIEEEPI